MVSKIIEIRDSGTFIPALAIRLGSTNERERYLLARSGFGLTFAEQCEYIVLCKINGEPCEAHIDPICWGRNPRTMFVAHMYLLNRQNELGAHLNYVQREIPLKHGGFNSLPQGALIDVEYILGLRDQPKEPE